MQTSWSEVKKQSRHTCPCIRILQHIALNLYNFTSSNVFTLVPTLPLQPLQLRGCDLVRCWLRKGSKIPAYSFTTTEKTRLTLLFNHWLIALLCINHSLKWFVQCTDEIVQVCHSVSNKGGQTQSTGSSWNLGEGVILGSSGEAGQGGSSVTGWFRLPGKCCRCGKYPAGSNVGDDNIIEAHCYVEYQVGLVNFQFQT